MDKEFYDRYQELAILKEKYELLKKGELILLYGRRRIGKTELVRHFLQSCNKSKNIYLYINKVARKTLMLHFSNDIKNQTNDDIRIGNTWNEFFDYLIEEAGKGKVTIVIDEFQRLAEVSEDFITILQDKWDSVLKHKPIMIILSGSSMGTLEDLFSSQGPLYGRCTFKIKLKPFRYSDFREMFSYLSSEEERINFFSTFGGTAHYLALAKEKNNTLISTVKELILAEGSPLYDEPLTLLSSELRSYTRHNSILIAISQGKKELPDIANELNLKQNEITPHLRHLSERLDIVNKLEPIFGKKKKTRYELDDNFFRFWYRFVFPNKSTLELRNTNLVVDKINEQIVHHTSRIFENIVRELLIAYNGKKIKALQLNFEKIGSWWEGPEEIDIVCYNKREIVLGEVKWEHKPVNGLTLLNDLQRKSQFLNFRGRIKYLLISKSGFTGDTKVVLEQKGITCLDLNDIEELFNILIKTEKTSQRKLKTYL